VLKSFIALVGVRAQGLQFQELEEALRRPWGEWRKMWLLGLDRVDAVMRPPTLPVRNAQLRSHAGRLGRLIRRFNIEVSRALVRHREEILERQYVQERLADAAIELFASACVLSRWDAELDSQTATSKSNGALQGAPDLFLKAASRRIQELLTELHDNDDAAVTALADAILNG